VTLSLITTQVLANKQTVTDIMNRLVQSDSQLRHMDIRMVYLNQMKWEAESKSKMKNGHRVYYVFLSKGTEYFFEENTDWEAIVIGHELGHIAHGELNPDSDRFDYRFGHAKQIEKEADLYGQQLANKAGYDGFAASALWQHMIDINGDFNDPDHPMPSERRDYLRCR
jgi:hypothetical protein